MVSPNSLQPDISVSSTNRGFVPQENIAAAAGPAYSVAWRYDHSFWKPVIGGSLFVLSLFILSWYFMVGCHVGVAADGMLALGWGAAVWMWVTSGIAFYSGGAMAGAISTPRPTSWAGAMGAAIWSLSILLGLVIFANLGTRFGLLSNLGLPHAGYLLEPTSGAMGDTAVRFGYVWSAFILLGIGLVSSIIGGISGCAWQKNRGTSER